MSVEWLAPDVLWWLLLVPAVWAASRTSVVPLAARYRVVHTAVRALLVATLVSAMAQPILTRASTRTAVVYAVDVSHSVSTRALDAVASTIDGIDARLKPDDRRVLAFAGRDTVLPDVASLRRLGAGEPSEDVSGVVGAESTNLEQALGAARAEIPAGSTGRIVVFTDGRETAGNAARAVARLAAERVPVFVFPMPAPDVGDVWIEDVRIVGDAVERAVSTVEVVIGAQREATTEVLLSDGGRVVARASTSVGREGAVVSLDVSFGTGGARVLEARLVTDGDPIDENNLLAREVLVQPRTRILYVQGDPADPGTAEAALLQAGLAVTRTAPGRLPTRAEAFDRWDVVLLANVPRAALPPAAMAALAGWVEHRGGGLLFTGGHRVVGESADRNVLGYRRTEIERVLPVTFDRDDEPEVALVIVLDRSWSMNGLAMELSKAAAEAAANTLQPSQMLGILTFNSVSNWDVPLARVRDSRDSWHEAIAKIAASGATAIFPALENAYDALQQVRARAKHVILLSDGQTEPQDFEGLVEQMAASRITVSSVALGSEADVTLLRNIATWGGGRSYVVLDAKQVPEIFVKEAKDAATPGAEEGVEITAVVRQPEALFGAATGLPVLGGRNTVTRKTGAIELIGTRRGDPILAVWPAGLGRTAMLATDVDGRWSAGWVGWRGFGGFLSATVRTLASRRLAPLGLSMVPGGEAGAEQSLRLVVESRDAEGRRAALARPSVVARSGAGEAATVNLVQVGPGRYEAHVVASTDEPVAFTVADPARGEVNRVFVRDRAAEYRFGGANTALLTDLAEATGGRLAPTPDEIAALAPAIGLARHVLSPWLFGLAMMLWLADLLVRRLWR